MRGSGVQGYRGRGFGNKGSGFRGFRVWGLGFRAGILRAFGALKGLRVDRSRVLGSETEPQSKKRNFLKPKPRGFIVCCDVVCVLRCFSSFRAALNPQP